jgi:hypothetical protein
VFITLFFPEPLTLRIAKSMSAFSKGTNCCNSLPNSDLAFGLTTGPILPDYTNTLSLSIGLGKAVKTRLVVIVGSGHTV